MPFRIIPREEPFHDLFVEHGAALLTGARLLETMLRSFDDIERRIAEVREAGERGFAVGRDISRRLETTFMTPFDRSDIHGLVTALDRALGGIARVAYAIEVFPIGAPTATAVQQASIIVRQAEQLHGSLVRLPKMAGVDPAWAEVHRLENEGDRLVRAAIGALFRGEPDPVEVLVWKTVYTLLEEAIDRCEDVAEVIERIVVKRS